MTEDNRVAKTILQGTDGVRGVALHSSHPLVRRLSPQKAFIRKGIITEQFVELYCYCVVRCMVEWGAMEEGREAVIGWDPRDVKKVFTGAAVSGVLRAGAIALTTGVLPTPAVPLYMLYRGARLSLVITASHNPPDQNGIKIFMPDTALKPLLTEDEFISRTMFETDYNSIHPLKNGLKEEDVSTEAQAIFMDFCCRSDNSWLEGSESLSDHIIIVDPANGACTDMARDIFLRLGAAEVIQVNSSREGPVNRGSGVTELEGTGYIDRDFQGDGGKDFSGNNAVRTLFEAGRKIMRGTGAGLVSAAVFDADGDRYYRIDYHPEEDAAIIHTGDQITVLQAQYLLHRRSVTARQGTVITTVESDINLLSHFESLGLQTVLTGVGDKWLLRKIAEERIQSVHTVGRIDQQSALSYMKPADEEGCPSSGEPDAFFLGSEESGHNVSAGRMEDINGRTLEVYIGNGVKSALNSYAATASLRSRLSTEDYWRRVSEPFTPGFKKTFYLYHTRKERFRRGTRWWNELASVLTNRITRLLKGRCRIHRKRFSEEKDMLYLSVFVDGKKVGAVFTRNSGTEEKTGISIRGENEYKDILFTAGKEGIVYLAGEIKNEDSLMGRASLLILEKLFKDGPQTPQRLTEGIEDVNVDRLLDELIDKESALVRQGKQLHLTGLGSDICRRRFGSVE